MIESLLPEQIYSDLLPLLSARLIGETVPWGHSAWLTKVKTRTVPHEVLLRIQREWMQLLGPTSRAGGILDGPIGRVLPPSRQSEREACCA